VLTLGQPSHGCDEIEESCVVSGELVVACGDTSVVFDFIEEPLDQIAFFVEDWIERSPAGGGLAAWDDGNSIGGTYGIESSLTVISLIGQDILSAKAVEESRDLGDVVALAARQNKAQGIAQRIGDQMDFAAQSPFRAPQRLSFRPFFWAPAAC
jgi:hypothetical protein